MADRLEPTTLRRLMQAVKGKNTGPELPVRSMLHRLSYRFRLHCKDLPGTPDIVLPGRGAAIFVHGCYWHGHGCRIGRLPKSKLDFWGPRIQANRERDERKRSDLTAAGWRVMTVWLRQLADEDALARKLGTFLGS